MRTGDITNPVVVGENDFETLFTPAPDTVVVPAITNTKTVLPPVVLPTIGSREHFRLEFLIPEGNTNSFKLTDNLSFGGVSYILENNGSFDISYTFEGITSIDGGAADETSIIEPTDGAVTSLALISGFRS